MTPPTCSCGAHYRRDTPQQAHCRTCIENAAEKRSQEPESTATVYPMTVLRLCKAIKREPGWPKGLVTVGGVITICSGGEINRHAHAGTLLLVLDKKPKLSELAYRLDEPRCREELDRMAREMRDDTGTLEEELEKLRKRGLYEPPDDEDDDDDGLTILSIDEIEAEIIAALEDELA